MVQHRSAHWLAADDAADDDRARGPARSGNCAVDPGVAGCVEGLGEFGHSSRFAARGPPVCDL